MYRFLRFTLVVVVVLAFALSSSPAQGTGALIAHLDYPAQGATVPPTVYLGGWALHCITGQQPTYLTLYDTVPGGPLTEISAYVAWRLYRPDVQAAYTGSCNTVSGFLGVQIYPDTPLSSGAHTLTVLFQDPVGNVIDYQQVNVVVQ